MNRIDKAKLKCILKMILINKSPSQLSANNLAEIVNKYKWGFNEEITSKKIGKLLNTELSRSEKHFLDCIESKTYHEGGVPVYYYASE